jgi:acyl-coenzyme A thioesterase PaaI-like protein
LQLDFVSGDDGSVAATFTCDETLEGYRGIMHGGMISSVLDGAMTHCMFAHGKTAVTAELSTRFRHPILIQQVATVSARIKRSSHPLYLLEAQIVQAGQVKATATGKFLDQPQLLIQRQVSHERVCLHNDTR